MIKVLHLRASNFYGGPERQLHFHARQANNSDYKIIVGSFSENNQTPEFLQRIADDSIETKTFSVKSAYDTQAVNLLKNYLEKEDIKILCTHDYRTHLIGLLASRKLNTKWIAFSRGWTNENFKIKLFHTMDKIIVRFADHIVAVSQSQKDKLRKLLISDSKISVVLNAIEPSAFSNIDPIDLKRKFDLPDDSYVGISGGRFSSEKGQFYLVEAVFLALNLNDKIKIIMFGDGPDYQDIKNEIRKFNLEDTIICPGFEKNLIGCLKGADFLVNPSLSEGLPNIVLEAMAMRILCIATAVGGVPELIDDQQNGLLVNVADSNSLSKAIIELAGDKYDKKKIIDNAYQTINDRFSFDIQFNKLSEIYKKIRS